ncbi:MAG: hypothetical protein ABI425_02600 [Patescibacteria group bacterium]
MFNKFKNEDFVLIHSTEGDSVGNFEVNKILSVTPENMDLKYPLTHTYKDDFQNHSQVIKIPQYSKVTIEKDIQFFHKARKEGLGGVIALMASDGFTINGYIVDVNAEVEAFELDDEKIKKSKSGVIFGLANYDGNIARKVFDLKLTTRYPTITLPPDKKLTVINNGNQYEAGKFQHITIPPDLNLHLTAEGSVKAYEFFKPKKQLISGSGSLNRKYIKLLSLTYPKISECPIFTNKQYSACFMVAFAKMPHWNSDSHFTLELFAIKDEKVRTPIGAHKKGELGSIHPFPAFYTDKASGETIKYYIQPFIVMTHDREESLQLKFW